MKRGLNLLLVWILAGVLISFSLHRKQIRPVCEKTPEEVSLNTELRGVWLRPPKNPAEIPHILNRIKKAGFNAVFLETFYHGFTIFPNSNVPLRPEYKGYDILQRFIREGHKRGLAIHCWTETFYWQVDTTKYPQFPRTPLFDTHPQWRLLTKGGKTTEVAEPAHIFADPANPDVRNFLIEYYRDLLKRYDIDGLNLDYIRYPSGVVDSGYTLYARSAFKQFSGIDPLNINRKREPKLWVKWVKWREAQITEFVGKVSELVQREKPKVMLSAAISPIYYRNRGKIFTFQDWATWLERNYLDAIIPMAYGSTLDSIRKAVVEVAVKNRGRALLVPALAVPIKKSGAYGSTHHPPIDEQVRALRSMGLKGHTVFCYSWILKSEKGLGAFKNVYSNVNRK